MNEMPIGVTCHNVRDKYGQWWIVWSPDFPPDKPGRKLHPESMFLEDAYRGGVKEVLDTLRKLGWDRAADDVEIYRRVE